MLNQLDMLEKLHVLFQLALLRKLVSAPVSEALCPTRTTRRCWCRAAVLSFAIPSPKALRSHVSVVVQACQDLWLKGISGDEVAALASEAAIAIQARLANIAVQTALAIAATRVVLA